MIIYKCYKDVVSAHVYMITSEKSTFGNQFGVFVNEYRKPYNPKTESKLLSQTSKLKFKTTTWILFTKRFYVS